MVEYVFSKKVTDNVPQMLMILSISWTVHCIIGLLLITDFKKKTNKVDEEHQNKEEDWKEIEANKLQKYVEKLPIYKLLFTYEFFHIYGIALTQIFFGYYLMNSYKTFGA